MVAIWALTALRPPDARITSAEAVAAKPDGIPVPHCKVLGVIGAEIRFQVLLPDGWNGRFLMGGNGGFAGSLDNDFSSVARGYAFADTDTGHQASAIQAGWAMGHPDRLANYGHVAVHRTADTAKAIVRAYYGRAAQYSYFEGCSNGGRQALMEAQRYPQDFDGLLAGAPAYDFTNIAGGFVKNIQAVFPTRDSARTPVVTAGNLALIERAALEACDASDGVRDNVIGAPDTCRFPLGDVKACPDDTAAADCLTAAQRKAIAAIYAPATAGAQRIYPGQPVGGENDENGWRLWITGVDQGLLAGTNGQASSLQMAFAPELFKYLGAREPELGLHHLRSRELGARHEGRRADPERRQSRPERAEGARRQADHLARVGRSCAECCQHDQLLHARPAARSIGEHVHAAIPAARRRALQRRIGAGKSGLADGADRVGRARQGTGAPRQLEDGPRRPTGPYASGLSVSAARGLQGVEQHGRRAELRVSLGTKGHGA